MIVQFWLGAILLIIIALTIFMMPFLRHSKDKQLSSRDKRNQLNRALYDVRIAELENDEQQGVLVDKEKIIAELQHNLLDDIDDQGEAPIAKKSKWLWLPGVLLLTFGSGAMYWSVGAYQEVNNWEQALQRYPDLQKQLFSNPNARPTEQELRDIMLGLRTKLASEPNDADGWLLYSRLGLVFKDTPLALDAVQKAYALSPNSVDVVLVYAQLKMQSGDEYQQQEAEQLLAQLLRDNPTEMQAWSMYAFMALEAQDYAAAIARWQVMLTLPEISAQQQGMLQDSIAYAKKQLQATGEPQKTAVEQSVNKNVTTLDEDGSAIYTVNVDLAQQMSLPDAGFVIIYAQAVTGPKMPLAAVKLAFSGFPISIQLGDANAMIEGMHLSTQGEFVVKARLSRTGDVMNSAGDLQGTSEVITAGHQTAINIMINEQL